MAYLQVRLILRWSRPYGKRLVQPLLGERSEGRSVSDALAATLVYGALKSRLLLFLERPDCMNVQEQLRQAIEQQQNRLRASAPSDRLEAILALVRTQDRLPQPAGIEVEPNPVTGRRLLNLGGNKALQLCIESAGDDTSWAPASIRDGWDGWAARFRQDCGSLAEAEQVLAHCETGFMRIIDDGGGAFHAWIATKRLPTAWRERADIAWWASSIARRHEPELRALLSERPGRDSNAPADDAHYRKLADLHLEMMAYQLAYPSDTEIGGCTIQTYRDVLGQLIAWALQARDRGDVAIPQFERPLITALASTLAVDPTIIGRAVAAFSSRAAAAAPVLPLPPLPPGLDPE